MQTIKITTSQNIEIDYEVAGLGERIVARIIDYGIFILIIIAIASVSVMGIGLSTQVNFFGSLFGIAYIIWLFAFIFYDLICEVFFNGQSAGKRIMNIKVISLDGARPSLGQYVIRWLFRIVDFLITFQLGGLISVILTKNKQR
ncbi:MAG: RDD family protein, partial [Sphingobacteriaceae bacterium]